MITNIELLYIVVMLSLALLFFKKARFFLFLPLSMAIYFIASTNLFSFGYVIPIFGYRSNLQQDYAKVLLLVFAIYYSSLCGHFLASKLTPERTDTNINARDAIERIKSNFLAYIKVKPLLLFVIGVMPVIFISLSIDAEDIWKRTYSNVPDYSNARMMTFADLSFWFSAACIPFIKPRFLSLVTLIIVVGAYAGLGERQAPVAIFLYVVISLSLKRNYRLTANVVLMLIGAYLLIALIGARPLNIGGLYFIASIMLSPSDFLSENAISYAINYMTNFSIVLNAIAILDSRTFSSELVLYGLLPVPSLLFDRSEEFRSATRILPHVPYPGFSMIYSTFGLIPIVIFSFVFSFALDYISRVLFKLRGPFDSVFYMIIFYIPLLFSLQYNLRSASRTFYAALAIYLIYSFIVNSKSFKFSR